MQRRATKKSTRAANSHERMFIAWCKEQRCVQCGNYGVIYDHSRGSAFIHNKVLIGHYFGLPLCETCDAVKTLRGHKAYFRDFGETQSDTWLEMIQNVPDEIKPPPEVIAAIEDWGR
jgi:hypothetical protein